MTNYTTVGELMKVAETKMDCQERTIKWFNRNKSILKTEWNNLKKRDDRFSNCPFETFILLTLINSGDVSKLNDVQKEYLGDVSDFYINNFDEVNQDYKVNKMGCKSLFEYIFTAFDRHNANNWSMSLSDVMGSFKNI